MTITLEPGHEQQPRAFRTAAGSASVRRDIRLTSAGSWEGPITTLQSQHGPVRTPLWLAWLINEEVPRRDRSRLISSEAMRRLIRYCSSLPENTPRPFAGVGDDATVGLEWDFVHGHIEIQVGNNSEVDSGIVETDYDDQLVEFPLNDRVTEPLARVFTALIAK